MSRGRQFLVCSGNYGRDSLRDEAASEAASEDAWEKRLGGVQSLDRAAPARPVTCRSMSLSNFEKKLDFYRFLKIIV